MEKSSFLDEKIVRMLDDVENPTASVVTIDASINESQIEQDAEMNTIYTGLKINGEWFDFEERIFVDNRLAMMIPKAFVPMDIESAKIKYPHEQRPETILTDETDSINIVLSYETDPVQNEEVETVRDTMMGALRRVNPGVKPRENGVEVISGKNIAYVEYSHPVLDGKLYNLMYFMELHGNLLIGNFNCSTKDAKYWKSIALEMMRSIRILSGLGNEE